MKTPQDPRHLRRIKLMEELFSKSFSGVSIPAQYTKLDELISASAPEWPLSKIAKIDLAILRLAAHELVVERKEPPKVIIDEAVELAKAYGNENSPKFVNGVLGTILKTL